MAAIHMKAGWNCVLMTNGEQSVTIHGVTQTPPPFASSWDMPTLQVRSSPSVELVHVYIIIQTLSQLQRHMPTLTLGMEMVQFSWIVCSVVLQPLRFSVVPAVQFSRFRPAVVMTMTLEWAVKVRTAQTHLHQPCSIK